MTNNLKYFILCIALAAVSSLTPRQVHAVEPSFRCTGNLNRTEIAICRTDRLALLDREMVARFRRLMAALSESGRSSLQDEQTIWLRGRNGCQSDRRCIERAYLTRINILRSFTEEESQEPSPPPITVETGSQGNGEAVITVRADGALERRFPDGTIVRRLPNGKRETERPDGTKTVSTMFTNVQVGNLPDLPPEVQQWGENLETSLLFVLQNVLTDEEYAAYLQTEGGKDGYLLIDWRVSSLNFLTAN